MSKVGTWVDQGEMETHIARMVRILVAKLKMDGITTLGNVGLSELLYEFLRGGRSRDLRFAEGDLTVLDEFIDIEWPKLLQASKKPPLEPGFTELPPKPKSSPESLFVANATQAGYLYGTITVGTRWSDVKRSDVPFWRNFGF